MESRNDEEMEKSRLLLFSIIPIRSIALLDNQAVNPVSSITLPFQAFHEFQKPILQFIRLGIQSFKLFIGYLPCFSITEES